MPIESPERKSLHGQWTSKFAFILAATGSAVGLGNIWRFPYVVGESGGGAFVLVYALCVLLLGLPVMMAEVMLGRKGRRNPIQTMEVLALEEGRTRLWRWLGVMCIGTGFLILSYYSVIGGWTLAYVFRTAGGLFTGTDAETVKSVFKMLTTDAERLIAWHTLFMVITVAVVSRGVQAGLEKAVRYLMPGLFLILLLLVLYATTTGYFTVGLEFLFVPDFGKLTGDSLLSAMGMAFFSLSIGMGAIMMYGAYLPKESSIMQTTVLVAVSDLSVALIAGIAIFPIVFAYGLEPSSGAGLVFQTLPLAFGKMHMGALIGTLFFLLLVFAAVTSAISLLEPPVAWLVEKWRFQRQQAVLLCGFAVWLVGLGTVFSFSIWVGYEWTLALDFGKVKYVLFEDKSFFDIIDFLTAQVMLPLCGLLITVFAGYAINREACKREIALHEILFRVWHITLRYIAPMGVFVVMLTPFGLLEFIKGLFS